jgi:4,4'-diaponeurosporenoate glycosyltransferase
VTDAATFVALWCVGWWLLWRVPVPSGVGSGAGADAASTGGGRPPVSVVVPARDEAHNVGALLVTLVPQLAPGDEVVVVDDGSTDATSAVAAAGGARVVPAPPLPAGWQGKSWACHTGAGAATGDLLVFLDADVRLEPGGLDRLVDTHAVTGGGRGLTSVQPWHRVVRPVEHLAAFCNLVAMMATGAFRPGADREAAWVAFGPCLVTSPSDYRTVGGHATVAAAVVDDVALARAYRAAGLPVRILGGRGSVQFRMYPQGLGQLVEGFTKNLALGAAAVRPLAVLAVAGWLAACAAPLVLAAEDPWLGAAAWAAVATQVQVHLRRIGSFGPLTAALYALPLLLFIVVVARSLVVTVVRRRVRWKGRDLPTR